MPSPCSTLIRCKPLYNLCIQQLHCSWHCEQIDWLHAIAAKDRTCRFKATLCFIVCSGDSHHANILRHTRSLLPAMLHYDTTPFPPFRTRATPCNFAFKISTLCIMGACCACFTLL